MKHSLFHTSQQRRIEDYFRAYRDVPMETVIYDKSGTILFVNNQLSTNGISGQELIGQTDSWYFSKAGIDEEALRLRRQKFETALNECRTVRFTEKLYFSSKKKHLYFKRIFQPIWDEQNKNVLALALFGSNLTAIILSQNELKFLAYHDKLTGLRNRDAFYEQLDQTIFEAERNNSQRSTAILFCDLDNFKLVNDSLGHDAGDLVLKEAARRMARCLRKSDYIFRLGGDEFTVILKNIQNEFEVGRVAEKLIDELSRPYEILQHQISYLTTSIGIVLFPRDGKTRETLVKRADTAMYNVKHEQKNSFQFFTADMTEKSIQRLQIASALRAMVANNTLNEELQLYYQPIFEKKNGRFTIVGSEALLRWNNPELGAVSPARFIPIAEESNLINVFGKWVLFRGINDYQELMRRTGRPLYLSVNLSARQIKSAELVSTLRELMKDSFIQPEQIQLEITETSYLADTKLAMSNIRSLKDQGFRFAIDDFGVGFASLIYLQRIPASTIKIDRSFIQAVDSTEKNRSLVKAIINLGNSLNKEVIAEGVEDQKHLRFLEDNSCFKYQGYYFSHPVALAEFEHLVQEVQ